MKISVITPVYNAQRFLEESARSALAQSETSELLLVDDGSTDGSLELCRRLADSDARVHALTHPQRKNLGPAATRNLGIEHARCEYIAFLDADDYFLPDRFRTARRLLENDSQVDGVYEAVRNFCDTPETQQWWRTSGEPDLYTFVEGVAPECLFEAMLQGKMGYFCTDGLTIRKRLLNKTGGFDTHLRWAEDTALWLKMAAVGRLVGGGLERTDRHAASARRKHRHAELGTLRGASAGDVSRVAPMEEPRPPQPFAAASSVRGDGSRMVVADPTAARMVVPAEPRRGTSVSAADGDSLPLGVAERIIP